MLGSLVLGVSGCHSNCQRDGGQPLTVQVQQPSPGATGGFHCGGEVENGNEFAVFPPLGPCRVNTLGHPAAVYASLSTLYPPSQVRPGRKEFPKHFLQESGSSWVVLGWE